MLILAFESSAKAASVALMDENTLLAESYQNSGLTHSVTLLKMAQDMLACAGKTPKDVTHAAVAAGPGSFTGIRIGVAAAKGFAWGLEIPCYGVSTLEAMARNVALADGIYCPVMDARRSQVYNALFSLENGAFVRLREDRAIALEELEADLRECGGPIYLVGDGAELTKRTLSGPEDLRLLPEQLRQQRAAGVALCAREKILAGEDGDGSTLVPNYLRLSQAERERLQRLGRID